MTTSRRFVAYALAAALLLGDVRPAAAQLDPLLFLKRVPPTVIVAFDTSLAMLEDGTGVYYDTNTYSVSSDPTVAAAFGLDTALHRTYRRKYVGLQYETVQDSSRKWEAVDIVAVPDSSPAYATFWDPTRFEIAKRGLAQAAAENSSATFRWGLVKHRQDSPAWRVSPSCDKPVRVTGNAALVGASDSNPCNAGATGRYGVYPPQVNNPNYSLESGGNPVVVAAGNGTGNTVATVASRPLLDPAGLIPASRGQRGFRDRPLQHLLEDAKAEVVRAMGADAASMRSCRNTVVVLIVAGAESGDTTYMSNHNAANYASTFLSVSASGVTKRVPIFVVAVKPDPAEESSLQQIATNSGGAYFNVSSAAGVARVINLAVQAGFGRATEFDTGKPSEFQAVSPIVGTVNLKNANDAAGNPLPNTDITSNPGGQPLPQRSNVILTAGFELPGFVGRLRAFRTYRPEPDSTKPTGWKFVKDGTRLWPDLDGRPQLAGQARTPADPERRNIFTYVPDGSGGGSVVAFTTANAPTLAPHLAAPGYESLVISYVRALPIGAIVGSTPALMDAPSLDPPPDDDYGRVGAAGSFADTYKDRRSIVFFGANDGMIHAVDARTGYEVWAFIPYNLLPKLKTLIDGQPVDTFDYFVDSSPKVAEVKMRMPDGSHKWRSLLVIGQGPGGVFYQAFDVTEAGMGVAPDADGLSAVDALLQRFDAPDESIQFKWAFPNYSSFDPTYFQVFTLSDATPGGKLRMFGDLKSTASNAEKSVGFTWSDPAVGPLNADRSVNAVIVGSGYFPAIEDALPGRGASAPRAGRAFYLLRVEDGRLLGGGSSCGTGSTGTGCLDVGEGSLGIKNALQADPSAAGDVGFHVVKKAYLGDLDGRYWRFNFDASGAITASQMVSTGQPIFSSSALLFVGTADVYMFFATGSDLLPVTIPEGRGTFKLYGLKDNAPAGGATTRFTINLATVSNTGALATGERASTAPSVAGDIVFYTTTREDATAPCGDFSARLYGLTYLGGAAYDSSGDNRVTTGESPIVKTVAGRATAPFIVDQHLYFGTAGAAGATLEAFGDPEDFNNGVGQVGIRILSWREIR